MEYKDYYKILGLSRDASADDIKTAYRKLARKYHPDVSKEANAEARFKEVNEANEVLKDPDKRAAYDALGSNWQAGQDFRPPPGAGGHYRTMDPEDLGQFSDFFSSIFGGGFSGGGGFGGGAGFGGAQQPRARRGSDQNARIKLTLEEAYQGGSRQLRLDIPEIQPDGRIASRIKTLNVRIPAGVTDGQQIRLTGQGSPGRAGGPAGDLFLEVELSSHPLYKAEGKDVHVALPLAPWEAALGTTISVPTLGGNVNLKIPAGARPGQRLRLKGRGLPASRKDNAGDAYVQLEIVAPPADTEAAREAYRRFQEAVNFDPRANWRT